MKRKPRLGGIQRGLAALVLATCAWVPCAHLLFPERTQADDAATLERLRAPVLAHDTTSFSTMRRDNPEWDLMGRLYLGLALTNDALLQAESTEGRATAAHDLATLDALLDDTEGELTRGGQGTFMLPYKDAKPWASPEGRSVFVDGEVLLLQSARALAVGARLPPSAEVRAAAIARAMKDSPSLSAESYPDEAWTFCNTTALAALSVFDAARAASSDGTMSDADREREKEHDALARAWVEHARAHLVEPSTGLLVTSYTRDGHTLQGPEGSSLFMVAHSLRFVDDELAQDQYARAKAQLVHQVAGFAYAEEWPSIPGQGARADIDSGPIIPIFHASAGASGLSILSARAFADHTTAAALERSLSFVAFPESDEHGRAAHYLAANPLGDALVVYARSFGPLLSRVNGHRHPRKDWKYT
jgi:hypothetical protein